MRKPILVLLIGLCMTSLSMRAQTSGSFDYTVSAGNVTITNFHCDMTNVVVPSSINGNPVRVIGERAFADCATLQSVTIPDSVRTVGFESFDNCANLTTVVLGTGLASIENSAFKDCHKLANLTIPNGLNIIGAGAFRNCSSLTTVILPDSVKDIGVEAFDGCSGMTEIVLSENLEVIRTLAFENCTSLLSISIPDTVTELGSRAFGNCQSLVSVELGEGITWIKDNTFADCFDLESVVIPASVQELGFGVFSNCSSLTEIWFLGRPPELGPNIFQGANQSLVANYLEGVPGWDDTNLEVPNSASNPNWLWGRFPFVSEGGDTWADTTYWMGLLEVSNAPWTWQPLWGPDVGIWYYITEDVAASDEGWIWLPDLEAGKSEFLLVMVPGTNWGYSFRTNKWVYVRPQMLNAGAGWIYVPYHYLY